MTGRVRKRGTRYQVIIDLGVGEDGRRKEIYRSGFETKKAARAVMTQLLHELQTGAYVEPSKLTVRAFMEQWLKEGAAPKVGLKTLREYTHKTRAYIIPALGDLLLAQLQPLHIQRFYNEAAVSGRKHGKGGLSAQTVLHLHRILHSALKQGVKWRLLAWNPADAVDAPKPLPAEINAPDVDVCVELLRGFAGHALFVPMAISIYTGMRRSEVLGLRWEDVDLDAGILRVRQALIETDGGRAGLVFKEPKTKNGRRPIELPPQLVEILTAHREKQREYRELLGNCYHESGLVACQEDGQPFVPTSYTRAVRAMTAGLGLDVKPNDLRHGYISQLLEAGVNVKVVSSLAGHSTSSFTLDRYGHKLPGAGRNAADKIGDAFRKKNEEPEAGT